MGNRKAPVHVRIEIDPARRIYANRNLRLASIRAIGFDMDHTLAQYEPLPFETLAFEKAAAKLVAAGYPRAVRRMTHDRAFAVRGLIVDKRNGNILKMDRHHYVVQASHGTRKMPSEMRKSLYANRRIRIGQGFAAVDTLFSLPEITLYAQLVDLLDRQGAHPNYGRIYTDVRAAVDEAHADGSIKQAIARDPERFLAVDPDLAATLDRMRHHGLRLFLLTNSEVAYTALIMGRLLDGRIAARPHWSDFFDLVVARAGKPGFFSGRAPLVPLAPRALGITDDSRPRFTYTGGSVRALEEVLGVGGDEVVYFGDHTYGDILKSKRAVGWRTALVIRDLEDEIVNLQQTRGMRRRLLFMERRIDRMDEWRDFLERVLEGRVPSAVRRRVLHGARGKELRSQGPLRLRVLQRRIERAAVEMRHLEAEIEARFNEHWGPLFRAGREGSHFAQQVERFACIYTSRVSNFANYPMEKYFIAPHTYMPHEIMAGSIYRRVSDRSEQSSRPAARH